MQNYNNTNALNPNLSEKYLFIPNDSLPNFINTHTFEGVTQSGMQCYCLKGCLSDDSPEERHCPNCGASMHIHSSQVVNLRHINYGAKYLQLQVHTYRFKCPCCATVTQQKINFKADNHFITKGLEKHILQLLEQNNLTLKSISLLTGVNRHIVKDIDKKRLLNLYTDGKDSSDKLFFKKPTEQAKYLAIDEFKIHDCHKFATHIINLENGHILWIAEGKKKQVVYNFIKYVGLEWMDNVVAVSCDMNSDFQEAFLEKCPHLDIVYDRFHLVKNFNDNVISKIRKDEYKRLCTEGKYKEAASLKGSKYILMSNRSTLQRKDADARSNKVQHQGSELFGTKTVHCKGGNEERYDTLLKENRLLFIADAIKEALNDAYKETDWHRMADKIDFIIDECNKTANKHFEWFAKLIINHYDGIISRAVYGIASGKIEGINQKIKTIRRQAYGLPDDEYFFLKIMDASRNTYTRDHKSHKFLP